MQSDGSVLDPGAMVLFFPAPKTTTGEPVLELHTHGSPAIVRSVLTTLGRSSSPDSVVRPAEPGEFTRRAFMNDRLSLPEVEALGDTLTAVTEEQRRISTQSATGKLTSRYEAWRQALLHARGELEALIDFAEDQHFDENPSELAGSVASRVRCLIDVIELHGNNAMRGELLRNGISLSLIGLPNVGKSSILNHMIGRNAAIVSKEAGTTRDVIEVGIDLGGYLCKLGDTAGLRALHDPATQDCVQDIGEVEKEGIRRAKAQALQAHVVILVLSVEPSLEAQGVQLQLESSVLETARDLLSRGKRLVVVINKVDRYELADESSQLGTLTAHLARDVSRALPGVSESDVFSISVRRAQAAKSRAAPELRAGVVGDDTRFVRFLSGLIRVFRDLTSPLRRERAEPDTLRDDPAGEGEAATVAGEGDEAAGLGATERQRALLEQCVRQLREFIAQVEDRAGSECAVEVDIVVAAESLRAAADSLAKITGRGEGAGNVEEVLGVVFEKFCVGK